MNYLNQIKVNLMRLPFILGSMAIAYYVGVHFGWREPIKDMMNLIPAFVGAIIAYIFIAPYIQTKQ